MNRDRDSQYKILTDNEYRIDTRGTRFILIKGVSGQSFDTFDEALNAALVEIDPKLVRYITGA